MIHDVNPNLNLGDITQVDEKKLNDFDLMTWGFPCTDLSAAGRQKGFIDENGNKTRSGMYYEGIRILREKKPKLSIIENVKALTSKKFAKEFQMILDDLDEAGYNTYYKILNAKDYGIPQNRERVFIISIRKDIDNGKFKFPDPKPLKIRLKDLLDDEVDEKYYLSKKMINYIASPNAKWTGNNGGAATDVAKKLNYVMTELYKQVKDVQFMIMGIGDLAYDSAPIQISQFESDIRIAEQLDKIYFEAGGGGNSFESYTAAWYMGSRHCKLDSWKRNKKGIIITMGDELINPYLPQRPLSRVTGDSLQGDVETDDLYKEASKKYSIYHLNVEHGGWNDSAENVASFSKVLGVDKVFNTNIDNIADKIIKIISKEYEKNHDVIKPTTPNGNQNQTQETVLGFETGIRW